MDLTALTPLAVPLLSFGAVATLVLAYFKLVAAPKTLARRLDRYAGGQAAPAGTPGGEPATAQSEPEFNLLREQKYSNWALLDQMIARRSWAEREAAELTRADLALRVGEFLMIRLVAAAGLAAVTLALTGLWFVVPVAAAVGYFIPRLWVKHCQRRRRNNFDDQLVEAMMLMASTLRSGYSFLQGMEAVARDLKPPVAEEFDRLIKEIGVGARADEALLRLIERVRSEDLELVVTAIMIQRQVGGELAGILDNIVKTIRERQKIKRDIQTLTAQQRWSGYIIGALPFILVVAISFVNRGYVDELLFTFQGQIMCGVALVAEVIGFFVIRRIIAIEV